MATILVADDNSNIQKMVTLALKDQGIDVISVGNGEAAVRKLPDLRPDLVLADVFMPVRNGYEVCEFVKHDARFAHIPVILLVGAFDPLDEREAKRVGADGVLKKPFVPPEPLITMVKSVLAKSAGEHLAPVAVSAERPASARNADSAEAPLFVPEPAELPAQEFAVHPERIAFGEGEKPLAFGELLQTPSIEPEAPEPEVTGLRETPLGEIRFLQSDPATEEPAAELEGSAWSDFGAGLPTPVKAAPVEEAIELESAESGQSTVAEVNKPEEQPGPLPELASSAAEWLESAPAHPLPALAPEASETWDSSPDAAVEPVPATPATEGGGSQEEKPAPSWPDAAAPALVEPEPMAEATPPASTVEPEPPPSADVQSFAVPQPPNPELVEAVVAKILERMQPQIIDIVTREILKPVVQALVRRELEKL